MSSLRHRGHALSRRQVVFGSLAAALPRGAIHAQGIEPFVLPMGLPDRIPGAGCYIRHGYACENPGLASGWWHTGENWYTLEGNSAGALIYAIDAGLVVYADADYPGRVVIIEHNSGLYSMYGHLDYALAVGVGDVVARGQIIGTVLFRTDSRSPSHLHFEVRRFFTSPEINGASPRYDYPCGVQCPPGPGYWPMGDPQHPSDLGWLNPMHVISQRLAEVVDGSNAEAVVSSEPLAPVTTVWSAPQDQPGAKPLAQLVLIPGERFPLLAVASGPVDSQGTSASAYRVWYQIAARDGVTGWVAAVQPSDEVTGLDGQSSVVRLDLLPIVG